jgi:predicted ferric reductase
MTMTSTATTTPKATRRAGPPAAGGHGSSAGGHRRGREALHEVTRHGVAIVVGLGFGAVVALAIVDEPSGSLHAPGGVATFAGNLAALVGTYLALVMVLLVSRVAVVEQAIGQDQLVRWHKRVSPWPLSLIALHAVLTTIGYAQAAKTGVWAELGSFVRTYPDMLAAVVGFGLMMVVGIVSIRAIRRRVRHETWWALHLYLYMALALSFAHQIVLGPSFVGHPLTVAVWSAAWAATSGLVLAYRVALPVVRTLRHKLRVVEVREEGPGVASIICEGRDLDRLGVQGGQFFAWRFLVRGMWWQAHPYSLSALPSSRYLRLTVKAVGDHSSAVATLRPGTRVAIEGPYGRFTRDAATRPDLLLLAAGIGVTALRALLEDLPADSSPVVVLRASKPEDLVLRAEIDELVRARGGKLHELIGSRHKVRVDRSSLVRLVPDLKRRDAFVCGPPEFVSHIEAVLRSAGIPRAQVHHEAFSL